MAGRASRLLWLLAACVALAGLAAGACVGCAPPASERPRGTGLSPACGRPEEAVGQLQPIDVQLDCGAAAGGAAPWRQLPVQLARAAASTVAIRHQPPSASGSALQFRAFSRQPLISGCLTRPPCTLLPLLPPKLQPRRVHRLSGGRHRRAGLCLHAGLRLPRGGPRRPRRWLARRPAAHPRHLAAHPLRQGGRLRGAAPRRLLLVRRARRRRAGHLRRAARLVSVGGPCCTSIVDSTARRRLWRGKGRGSLGSLPHRSLL